MAQWIQARYTQKDCSPKNKEYIVTKCQKVDHKKVFKMEGLKDTHRDNAFRVTE